MKVMLYMAMSANGMIAHMDGNEDFLSHENWLKFADLVNEYGNFIVGRKTYEQVKKWNEYYSFDDFINAEKIIISHERALELDHGYTLANSPEEALEKLSAKGHEKALLTGGASVNAAFAKKHLLNEILLNVEPVFIGHGVPVFSPEDFEMPVTLLSIDKSESGIVTLRYKVL